jgi:hypothetical protein
MRRRPTEHTAEETFINQACADRADQIEKDLHMYVKKTKWPVYDDNCKPSMAHGSTLRKPILLSLKEYEWNSIHRHTQALGVSKASWFRHAILKLLSEEQQYFANDANQKNE